MNRNSFFTVLFLVLSAPVSALSCLVVGITDGDTFTARCGDPGQYEQVKVRLAEIDAPESKQPFGQRSRQALADLCHGVQAEIRAQSKDRYGRTLGRVTCRGQDANAEQVKQGMAWVYDQYTTDKSLYKLQDDARDARRGLWADQKPVAPWEWRRARRKK
jgi:endonuclease YncB( thermonuclease family)